MNSLPGFSINELFKHKPCGSCESEYRRGYRQGYAAASYDAFDLAAKGFSRVKEVANILDYFSRVTLLKWSMNKKLFLPPSIDIEDWPTLRNMVFERDGRICEQCGTKSNLQIDHIIPVKDGGTPSISNLRVLCKQCNIARNKE